MEVKYVLRRQSQHQPMLIKKTPVVNAKLSLVS
jgi:hypothetical protein